MSNEELHECPQCKGTGKVILSIDILAQEKKNVLYERDVECILGDFYRSDLIDFLYEHFPSTYSNPDSTFWRELHFDTRMRFVLQSGVTYKQLLDALIENCPSMVVNWCKRNNK